MARNHGGRPKELVGATPTKVNLDDPSLEALAELESEHGLGRSGIVRNLILAARREAPLLLQQAATIERLSILVSQLRAALRDATGMAEAIDGATDLMRAKTNPFGKAKSELSARERSFVAKRENAIGALRVFAVTPLAMPWQELLSSAEAEVAGSTYIPRVPEVAEGIKVAGSAKNALVMALLGLHSEVQQRALASATARLGASLHESPTDLALGQGTLG